MKHGRIPIGDGVVDKAIVLAHSKYVYVRPHDPGHYESVLQENAQLKTNNDILAEENRIHHELFKVIFFPLYLQLLCPKHTISFGYFQLQSVFDRIGVEPPAELLQRLQDLDARRHQVTLFIEFVCAIHILYFDHNSSRELILFRGRMPIRVAAVNKWILVD